MKKLSLILMLLGATFSGFAQEPWSDVLKRMPLGPQVQHLNHSNCAQVLLGAFQSNAVAKALIFLPGATDELYFFRRVEVVVTNGNPTLYDAVVALTNQSHLRITWQAPFVLLRSDEDVWDLEFKIQHEPTAQRLRNGKPFPHLEMFDRDWTQFLKLVEKGMPATLLPFKGTTGSWHFYRLTLAGWNLTPWEVMEAAALAGKTKFTVIRRGVVFELDERTGVLPKLEQFPPKR